MLNKSQSPILCVDFDGTIVEHEFPHIGKPLPDAFTVLKEFMEHGDRLILWTCREGTHLQDAIDFCAKNGIFFEVHNQNVPEHDYAKSRKPFAHRYIDDRMIGGFPGWNIVKKDVDELRKLLSLK